jgi:hypothetical protein
LDGVVHESSSHGVCRGNNYNKKDVPGKLITFVSSFLGASMVSRLMTLTPNEDYASWTKATVAKVLHSEPAHCMGIAEVLAISERVSRCNIAALLCGHLFSTSATVATVDFTAHNPGVLGDQEAYVQLGLLGSWSALGAPVGLEQQANFAAAALCNATGTAALSLSFDLARRPLRGASRDALVSLAGRLGHTLWVPNCCSDTSATPAAPSVAGATAAESPNEGLVALRSATTATEWFPAASILEQQLLPKSKGHATTSEDHHRQLLRDEALIATVAALWKVKKERETLTYAAGVLLLGAERTSLETASLLRSVSLTSIKTRGIVAHCYSFAVHLAAAVADGNPSKRLYDLLPPRFLTVFLSSVRQAADEYFDWL